METRKAAQHSAQESWTKRARARPRPSLRQAQGRWQRWDNRYFTEHGYFSPEEARSEELISLRPYPYLNDGARYVQSYQTLLPPLDFRRDVQAVIKGRAGCPLGFPDEFPNFQFQLRDAAARVPATRRRGGGGEQRGLVDRRARMYAGIGQNLGSIGAHIAQVLRFPISPAVSSTFTNARLKRASLGQRKVQIAS